LRTAWSGDFNPSKEAARRKLLYLHRVLRLKDLILDRFHIVAKMNKALDEVRAGESRRIASDGRTPLLKKSRWLLLKRVENLKKESVLVAQPAPLSPEDRPRLPSQGSLSPTPGLPLAGLGREVS